MQRRRVLAGPQCLQRLEVAVADHQLGLAAQQRGVDAVDDAHAAVAAANGANGGHLCVGQRGVQVGQAGRIGTGQVVTRAVAPRVDAAAVIWASIIGATSGSRSASTGPAGETMPIRRPGGSATKPESVTSLRRPRTK